MDNSLSDLGIDFNAVMGSGSDSAPALPVTLAAGDAVGFNVQNVDFRSASACAAVGGIAFRQEESRVKSNNSKIAFPFLGF